MSLGKAPGAAVRSWGSKLLRFYGKEPVLSRAGAWYQHSADGKLLQAVRDHELRAAGAELL